ncbi:MAG: diguanylate cyclase, partial [Rhodobacteraceae bacterium]|nr:diguanylate cyclase [Paracoccaceae bacterium]
MRPVADVLRRSLRGFDLACRIGSDSFAILMPGASAEGARNAASRLCAEIGAEKVRVTESAKTVV